MTVRQLELFAQARPVERAGDNSENAGRISRYLSSRCGRTVKVVFTDNTSTMITVNRSAACKVRMHHMFADAPQEVLNALAVYVKWPRHKASNATLSRYIREKGCLIKSAPKKALNPVTSGRYFDLELIYKNLNEEYFDNKVTVPITWGKPFRKRRRRSIRFGSVDHKVGVIRINPSLDARYVPAYFIEYIVFHEMLHCLIDAEISPKGRTLAHHSGFRKREKEYARYREALKWQDENIQRFLKR
jgi:hypothetical protein